MIRGLFYWRKEFIQILLSVMVLSLIFSGCASKSTVKKDQPEMAVQATPSLTSITVEGNSIVITADTPFEYTLYKPNDPFRTVVELKGIVPGSNLTKMEFSSGPVSEIKPSHIKTPQEGTRLDILLSTPAEIIPEYTSGRLVLNVSVPEAETEAAVQLQQEPAEEEAYSGLEKPLEEIMAAEELPMSAAQYIEDVEMSRQKGKVVVLIKGDGRVSSEIFTLDNKIVVDVMGVEMKAVMPDTVIKPVKGIRWGRYEDKTRIVIDLEPDTDYDVISMGDTIQISLRTAETLQEELISGTEEEEAAVAAKPATTPMLKGEKIPEVPPESLVEGRYSGTRISLDFQDADIVPIFRLLADVSGYNIVVDPGVKGKITMKLLNVPWDQALDLILKTFKLDKEVEGNIIRIAPVSVLAKEREEKARIKAAQQKAEPLVTKVFPISYANVNKVKTAIEQAKILSKRGNISVEERISSLIIKDVKSNIPKIEQLIKTLDKPTPQVMIEARIVEVNSSATKEFGIRWGTTITSTNKLATFQGLTPYVVDFPSAAGPGSGSGFTFGFINPTQTLGIDLEISALETSGKLKIISNPRIITVDNQEAVISQGKSIPVRKLTSEGTVSTEFKDIKLELKVKPHITPDGSIILNVHAKKEELDPTIPSVEGVPGTDKKETKTNVIIKDGETFVIGGIYKSVNNDSESGVPTLKNIPVLGWLFKNKKKEAQTNELLIFITPRIITPNVKK